jgi:membrane-associated phospholipid phosphatase
VLDASSTSFPSGHTSFAAVTCVSLVLAFAMPGRRRVRWPLAVLGIGAMGWSRTFLHVHWLSDVIAGALLGVSVALLVFAAAQLRAAARS